MNPGYISSILILLSHRAQSRCFVAFSTTLKGIKTNILTPFSDTGTITDIQLIVSYPCL